MNTAPDHIAKLSSEEQILREKEKSMLLSLSAIRQELEKITRSKIQTSTFPTEVIGSSKGLASIFQMIASVAPSTSTVLILGETGTGKELIAKTIHDSSPRRGLPMIKVNCAALPTSLIESELFGHEKGSFTGALDRRIGKFELANGTTLFLDEVGEMPIEVQVKLLRAIQEKEFERIGGVTTIFTDVRIIAATSRNLSKEIDSGRFRSDLFYRLNVFPITLPPLRERKEDIPALVAHFIRIFSLQSAKDIIHVAPTALRNMMLYDWPGNIRELEHAIERSVLMTKGSTIKEVRLPRPQPISHLLSSVDPIKSLKQIEREHILAALKKSGGRVGGEGGAAEILHLPPTTLHSKIKKLGIKKLLK